MESNHSQRGAGYGEDCLLDVVVVGWCWMVSDVVGCWDGDGEGDVTVGEG